MDIYSILGLGIGIIGIILGIAGLIQTNINSKYNKRYFKKLYIIGFIGIGAAILLDILFKKK